MSNPPEHPRGPRSEPDMPPGAAGKEGKGGPPVTLSLPGCGVHTLNLPLLLGCPLLTAALPHRVSWSLLCCFLLLGTHFKEQRPEQCYPGEPPAVTGLPLTWAPDMAASHTGCAALVPGSWVLIHFKQPRVASSCHVSSAVLECDHYYTHR